MGTWSSRAAIAQRLERTYLSELTTHLPQAGRSAALSFPASPIQAIKPLMSPIISVANLSKTYGSGFKALDNINLEIRRGEIFALLGPNGAGKTTLISIVCGIANPTSGNVSVDGHDIIKSYRAARSLIGLVPQKIGRASCRERVYHPV